MRTDLKSQSVVKDGNSGNGLVKGNSNSCRQQLSVES